MLGTGKGWRACATAAGDQAIGEAVGMEAGLDRVPGQGRERGWWRWQLALVTGAPQAELGSFRWGWLMGQEALLVVDGDAAIHADLDLDLRLGVAGAPAVGKQLEALAFALDGVVRGDGALELEAEDLLGPEAGWGGAI